MRIRIEPSAARGSVAAPPSKSMAHRMLICAGLAAGESVIEGIAPSQDVLATLDCLEALGARYRFCPRSAIGEVSFHAPEEARVEITGVSLRTPGPQTGSRLILPCRECGSTLRFLIPVALLTGKTAVFTGSQTLLQRPLTVYEDICRENGFLFQKEEGRLTVSGSLQSGTYRIPGNISSQFVSGLLFALPNLEGESVISLIPPVESRPYIDMTLQALAEFGIRVISDGEDTLRIPGGQHFAAGRRTVEGDYSNAAFLEALNLAGANRTGVKERAENLADAQEEAVNRTGARVEVTNLAADSLQGDRVYREIFRRLQTEEMPVIDLADCPDLGPVCMAGAALTGGAVFTGTRRLRIKESDRGAAMKEELAKFGIETQVEQNRITVRKGSLRKPDAVLCGHNDHRIVMALSVLASVTGGVIDGAEAVQKSFPDFFERIGELGIEVTKDGMDQ